MNKFMMSMACVVSFFLMDEGISIKTKAETFKGEYERLAKENLNLKESIRDKELLTKHKAIALSAAYEEVMNQVSRLESYSGTSMNVQLEGLKDADDIAHHYVDTSYQGVKGLKVRIVIDKFSRTTDMGAVLDDIHLLEKSTDFMALDINKDNNNLIVKGEIYGI